MSSIKFRHNIALLIGINDYQDGVPILKTPVNDAQTLAEMLQTHHDYQIHVLLNQDAKRNSIITLLEELSHRIEASDRLLFYFAGHGIALNGEDGPEGYLIPQDARLGEISTYLSMAQVHNALLRLPCSHFLGILDCCFAGSFRWSSTRKLVPMDLGVIHQERFDRFIQDPAWQVITSAAYDQTALDAFDLQCRRMQSGTHSPFAAALLEALQGGADAYPPAESGKPAGDGVITATELYLYLRDRVELATEADALRQTPGIHPLKKHDKGEYIFLTPGHDLNLPPAPPLDESKNPYRGLRSFEEQHSELFFGRSDLIEKLHHFVKTHPLTVVLGASGSGKSSLVKAGLIPKLKQEAQATHENWCILSPIRPGEAPFQALNNALAAAQLPAVKLHNPQKTLAQSIAVWANKNSNSKLLIFIDQSEEIMTLCPDETERQEFFQQILTAIETHRERLQVVLTLRSDFEPQVRDVGLKVAPEALNKLGYPELKHRWQSGRFIVPAMTRTELREAIERPAEARVMYFQPHELVEQLIDEVADMPGALPLLSFALSELYLKYLRRQQDAQTNGVVIDRALTQDDYQDLGGVIQSLTQKADQEYQALVQEDPAYAQIVSQVMLRMVALGGGELARRQVPLSELKYPPPKHDLVEAVIERFTNARLLVTGKDAQDHFYVEPAHDALVRGWQRLLNWLKEEKNLRLQRRLTPAALEWKNQQQSRFLWNTDPYLDVLQKEVLNSENNWLNQVETEFVQSSLQKRRTNHCRLVVSITGVILALSGFASFAGYQWRTSEIQQINALRETSSSLLLSHQELEAVIASLRTGKAVKQSFWQAVLPDFELTNQVTRTLQKVLSSVKENNRLRVGTDITTVAFSPGDQMIATSLASGTAQLWKQDGSSIAWPHNGQQALLTSSTSGQKAVPIVASSADKQIVALDDQGSLRLFFKTENHAQPIFISAIAFNPTQKSVALAAGDRVVLLSLAGDRSLNSLAKQRGSITALAFSRDGKTLATASTFATTNTKKNEKRKTIGTVQIWNAENGTLLKTLKGDMNGVQQTVAISPDRQMVAASGWYGATLWKSDGTWHKKLEGHSGAVNTISFSPNGKMIATGGVDKIVKLWKLDGTLDKNLVGHNDAVWEVNFSPDSQTIASASSDNTVKLWNSDDGTLLSILEGHGSVVRAIEFSHDGKKIASASDDGIVKLWQLGGSSLKDLLHDEQVYAVAFSPNGRTIATAHGHGWLTLWNSDGRLQRTYKWHGGPITAVAFSPNGQMIATAAWDRGVQIHNSDGTVRKSGAFLERHRGEPNQQEVKGLSFSPDSQMIASAGADGTVQLFNSDNGKLLKTLDKQNSSVWDVSFSPKGQMIASANSDGTVKLWNRDGTLRKTLVGHQDRVFGLAFSPDGQTIASASGDKTVKLWHSDDGKLLITLTGHKNLVSKVAFSPNGQIIASASYDNTVKLWNRDGTLLKTLSGHEAPVSGLAFSPDGQTIASASYDRTVILQKWQENLDIDRLLGYGCQWTRDYLKHNPNVDESDRHLCDDIH